jgi:hypothetical protein
MSNSKLRALDHQIRELRSDINARELESLKSSNKELRELLKECNELFLGTFPQSEINDRIEQVLAKHKE